MTVFILNIYFLCIIVIIFNLLGSSGSDTDIGEATDSEVDIEEASDCETDAEDDKNVVHRGFIHRGPNVVFAMVYHSNWANKMLDDWAMDRRHLIQEEEDFPDEGISIKFLVFLYLDGTIKLN